MFGYRGQGSSHQASGTGEEGNDSDRSVSGNPNNKSGFKYKVLIKILDILWKIRRALQKINRFSFFVKTRNKKLNVDARLRLETPWQKA